MPRIAGVDIPENKKILVSLTYIYGVGPKIAANILKTAGVNQDRRAKELTGQEINSIQRELEKLNIEGDLRRVISDNIDRLKRIKSYRGFRHIMGLPTRGQRTRVNARTRKGKRKTVGSMTKEMASKLDSAKK